MCFISLSIAVCVWRAQSKNSLNSRARQIAVFSSGGASAESKCQSENDTPAV